ncbi:MAG: hypothetical protein RL131_1548 [Bacteroidota bacterium]
MKKWVFINWVLALGLSTAAQDSSKKNSDSVYRPLIHFTPSTGWMNDPNGMVFYKGTYHVFYQHNPNASVWGPMHWGHATSSDLIDWKHQPIALYPDSLGTIFSGSAVVDHKNSSGLGTADNPPLVAIFTYHNQALADQKKKNFQTQGIAYSLDNGVTWKKYEKNPVIQNPGIPDFRDPKVTWLEDQQKWVMALAVQDRIYFYGSKNLLQWEYLSQFGKTNGAHGGVWECPDLFPMEFENKTYWVLIVNINPGGPNGGSATQYFIGNFDGREFKPFTAEVRWLDFGPDEYAGVSWFNTSQRRIFIGWMSNWSYANVVPTETWRSALTIPRELSLVKVKDVLLLKSLPVKELSSLIESQTKEIDNQKNPFRVQLTAQANADFSVEIFNDQKEKIILGYDKKQNQFYIDRTNSGKTKFYSEFGKIHTAPRISNDNLIQLDIWVDRTSVELFADEGLTVMTSIFFPNQSMNKIKFNGKWPKDKSPVITSLKSSQNTK